MACPAARQETTHVNRALGARLPFEVRLAGAQRIVGV